MKPPVFMYKHDVESIHDIHYYDRPLKGLTYVDKYLYMFEWDWDAHRYMLVRLSWLEAKYQLTRAWLFRKLVLGTMHKPKWIKSVGWFLWYDVINLRRHRRARRDVFL